MDVHLIDGTYELFRHYYALPSMQDEAGHEVAAVRGVLTSVLAMLKSGATHLGVATDHVVESFRNDLYHGYKTGRGMPEDLLSQFPLLEEALEKLGVVVWPMVELEADDALGAAAKLAARDRRVETVYICSPDKDLAQCVKEARVVQLDRRTGQVRDARAVEARFGVTPSSIPDYLALVGDTADGYPGVRGWGAKSAAAVLHRFPHLEEIPKEAIRWKVPLRNAAQLGANLVEHWDEAMLFRDLATLRTDAKLFRTVEALRWTGPKRSFKAFSAQLGAPALWERARAEVERRSAAGASS
ncbi:MAG TPA: 5'-3' exonuclease H3TH domain-containing protein [Candidatus Krumholzibacteria bacterium]|nr:5'-3' exonuclease H3TH domain-containing protein [Candidatus Krumholzibacteria bacterium]